MEYRDALLDAFDGYFKKYVSLMHSKSSGVNVENNDTKNFLRLFMKKEDRLTQKDYLKNVGSYIHMIRRVLSSFTADDLYHELIVSFLGLIEKYHPVTYKRNEKEHRISFSHYVQVNIRYNLVRWIFTKSRDVLTGRDWLEYREELHESEFNYDNDPPAVDIGINLQDWVWGDTAEVPFSTLTEMERYLLWLRYEGDPYGKKISTREMGEITGYHQRTIIYKLERIKDKLSLSKTDM